MENTAYLADKNNFHHRAFMLSELSASELQVLVLQGIVNQVHLPRPYSKLDRLNTFMLAYYHQVYSN